MKKIIVIICLTAIMSSGCSNKLNTPVATSSTNTVSIVSPTENTPSKGERINHEFKSFVYTDFYRNNFDETTETAFRAYCEAVANGETEFSCEYRSFDTIARLKAMAFELMPIAAEYATIVQITQDNIAHIDYGMPQKDFLAKLEEFKTLITEILDETCKAGYSDTENALALYDYFVNHYQFDYNYNTHFSYDFLINGTGICQDIASAYNYLLAQTGVEAFLCWDGPAAHIWSEAELDGKYYHIDPTFGITHPEHLQYFGTTDERRSKENYNPDDYTFSFRMLPDPENKYRVTDNHFLPLSDSTEYEINFVNSTIYYISKETGEKKSFRYE